MPQDILRRLRFAPYRKGFGPTFTLTIWDTHRTIGGKSRLGYRLEMREHYNAVGARILKHWRAKPAVTLFQGEDFGASPLHSTDSDATAAALMGFLTLRPGDTDAEYFSDYSPEQLAYCAEHAESLACEVAARLGE